MNKQQHEYYMQKALMQASVAFRRNEVPIGAVIVDAKGKILARAHNKIEQQGCQTAHAEVLAIQSACKKSGDWRLDGCWLYVTLEPCLMCYGLIHLSRLAGVCYAADSPLFGYGLVKHQKVKDVVAKYAKVAVQAGLKEQESVAMLKAFFKRARKRKKEG